MTLDLLISVFHSLIDGSERIPDKALEQGHGGKEAQDVPAPFVRFERDAGIASGRGILAGFHDC